MKFETVEQHNKEINKRGFVGYEGKLVITFRDRKKVTFTIHYGEYGELSQDPHFSTSAQEFNRNRTDYDSCGQAQQSLLKNKDLKTFFEKWDKFHLSKLTFKQYDELIKDINNLKQTIPYIESDNFADIVQFDRKYS